MNYAEKYLKYKQKYMALKQYVNQQRGGNLPEPDPNNNNGFRVFVPQGVGLPVNFEQEEAIEEARQARIIQEARMGVDPFILRIDDNLHNIGIVRAQEQQEQREREREREQQGGFVLQRQHGVNGLDDIVEENLNNHQIPFGAQANGQNIQPDAMAAIRAVMRLPQLPGYVPQPANQANPRPNPNNLNNQNQFPIATYPPERKEKDNKDNTTENF
jgi:hypothetical protein